MRIAIIDCGTNTFHLLIIHKKADSGFQKIFKTKAVVKLGQGGINRNFIEATPYQRGLSALRRFKKFIDVYKPAKVIAFGTAAIRKATNGKDFIQTVKSQTGITIELISGRKEAALIYEGVKRAMDLGSEKSLIMDIGGGSTEFIICNRNKIFWRESFQLGASLLTEKFKPSDPITRYQVSKLNNHFRLLLAPLFFACTKFQPKTLVGSSGSFDTFCEMILHSKGTPSLLRGKREYTFDIKDYYRIHNLLLPSTVAQRKQMKGLVNMRVELIVPASLLLTFVLRNSKIKNMRLSAYALKEGVVSIA